MSETAVDNNVKKRKISSNNHQKQKQSKLEKPTSLSATTQILQQNTMNNNENTSSNGDQRRIMDAADTLVSLAHSTTPTENKKIIELINQHCNQTNNENNNNNCSNNNTNGMSLDKFSNNNNNGGDLFLKSPTASKLIAEFLKHCTPNPNSITTTNTTNTNTNANNNNNKTNNITHSTNNNNNNQNNVCVNEKRKSDENKNDKNSNNNNNKRSNSISSSYSSSSSANDDLNDAVNNDSSLSQYSLNLSFNDKNSSNQAGVKAEKKSHKRSTSAENRIKYGPIHVRPRSKAAPTLATGRKSKDVELPPDEEKRRNERRERNKEAAAKCRRKREEVAVQLQNRVDILNKEKEDLLKTYDDLQSEKRRLETQLKQHEKKCKKFKIEHTVDTAATLAANQLSLFAQLTPPPSSTSIKKIFEDNNSLLPNVVVPTSTVTSTSTTTTATSSGVAPATTTTTTNTSTSVDVTSNGRQQSSQLTCVKIENDDEQQQTVKKESPMISGCSPKANLNELQQEFQQNIVERPKNLNLHCMLLRQDSLSSATTAAAAMAQTAGSFLAASTASPTFTLNTPIFALTPIEPSTLFSPTNGMQTPRLFAILKPV